MGVTSRRTTTARHPCHEKCSSLLPATRAYGPISYVVVSVCLEVGSSLAGGAPYCGTKPGLLVLEWPYPGGGGLLGGLVKA